MSKKNTNPHTANIDLRIDVNKVISELNDRTAYADPYVLQEIVGCGLDEYIVDHILALRESNSLGERSEYDWHHSLGGKREAEHIDRIARREVGLMLQLPGIKGTLTEDESNNLVRRFFRKGEYELYTAGARAIKAACAAA